MPRLDPRPQLRQGQLPQIYRRPWKDRLQPFVELGDLDDLTDYIDKLVEALENYRHEFVPKLEIKIEVAQATTTALAPIEWEALAFDNGGWWVASNPTVLRVPLSRVYQGVFQTKLDGAGSIRVQIEKNGSLMERGMDVVLNGDFTFSFAWQDYYFANDEIEINVSTSGSVNLVGEWTRASLHALDFVEVT